MISYCVTIDAYTDLHFAQIKGKCSSTLLYIALPSVTLKLQAGLSMNSLGADPADDSRSDCLHCAEITRKRKILKSTKETTLGES